MSVAPAGREANVRDWKDPVKLPMHEDYLIDPEAGDIWLEFWFETCVKVETAAKMFDGKRKLMGLPVYHANPQSSCQSVIMVNGGRGRRGGCNNVFLIKLSSISVHVGHILILAFVRSDLLGNKLNNARVVMKHGQKQWQDAIMCHSDLKDLPGPTMVLGQLTRQHHCWSFRTLKSKMEGEEVQPFLLMGGSYECLKQYPATFPAARRVVLTVLEGKDLAAKDRRWLIGEAYSSDPYFVIKFKDREFKSDHKSKTLEPKWESKPFVIREIMGAEKEEVEIAVYDYDYGRSDDFMGVTYISAGDLFEMPTSEHDAWFGLQQSRDPKLQNEEVSGKIHIKFEISRIHNRQ